MEMINKLWEDLDSRITENTTGILKKLINPEASMYISIGTFINKKNHFLTYEVREENINNYKTLPNIKGIKYQKINFGDEKEDSISLVLSASLEIYNYSFNVLAEDLIEFTKGINEKDLIDTLASRLHIWKNFFSNIPVEILSEEKQIGLAGELNFMLLLINQKIPPAFIINSWKGFENSSKDFIFSDSICTEVKASKSPKTVKISSKEQLDETDYEKLFLYYGKFSYNSDTDLNLNSAVNQIREILENFRAVLENFEYGLVQYGYYDIHSDYYNRCYEFNKELCFIIKDNFPRIKESDTRQGVVSVKYIIDLTESQSNEIPITDIYLKLKEIIDG
jgi:hypothetical protein